MIKKPSILPKFNILSSLSKNNYNFHYTHPELPLNFYIMQTLFLQFQEVIIGLFIFRSNVWTYQTRAKNSFKIDPSMNLMKKFCPIFTSRFHEFITTTRMIFHVRRAVINHSFEGYPAVFSKINHESVRTLTSRAISNGSSTESGPRGPGIVKLFTLFYAVRVLRVEQASSDSLQKHLCLFERC